MRCSRNSLKGSSPPVPLSRPTVGRAGLAAHLVQGPSVRLADRGEMPDRPALWLVTVALNLFRNVKTTRSRRRWLLTATRVDQLWRIRRRTGPREFRPKKPGPRYAVQ